jgi:hypothetical protein
LIKSALASAWVEMLTPPLIGAPEKINESHVGCVLGLTLLAPDIVEAVLNRRQTAD